MDDELDAFKKQIDLRDYARTAGYNDDKEESTKSTAVLRRGADKIHVWRNARSNDWVWHCHHDGAHGTILDFLELRQGVRNVGTWRKELRPWIVLGPSPRIAASVDPPLGNDSARVSERWAAMPVARCHPYLVRERAIPGALLESPRFNGTVRVNRYRNAVFGHFDDAGLMTGFEIRGGNFKGFSKGGRKGLWRSQHQSQDTALVFSESAINSLSYAALYPSPCTRYASTAGEPSAAQREIIRAAIQEMPANSRIVAAMDNDSAGRSHAAAIAEVFRYVRRADLSFREHYPEGANDWNDLLKLRGGRP